MCGSGDALLEGVCAGLLWEGPEERKLSITGNGRSAKVWGGGGLGLSKLGRECQSSASSPQVTPFLCRRVGERNSAYQLLCSWRGLPVIHAFLGQALR